MVRIRQLRKYGNSYVIPLASIDIKDFDLKEGDDFDIELLLVARMNKKKRTKK